VEDIGNSIFGSGNKAKRNQDGGREGKEYIGLANSRRS